LIGALTPNSVPYLTVSPGEGPRHLAFHPDGRRAYLVVEMGSALLSLHYDPTQGTLKAFQQTSTLPSTFNGTNTASEIIIHPNGKTIYVGNRGHDSVAIFRVEQDGTVRKPTWISANGKTPRGMALSEKHQVLYVASQAAGTISSFAIQPDGLLKFRKIEASEVQGACSFAFTSI